MLLFINAILQFTKGFCDNKYYLFRAYYGTSSLQTTAVLSHLIIITI